jgi:type IV secretion system protein VirB10
LPLEAEGALNPRDEASRQDEKEQFLSRKRDPNFQHRHRVERPSSPYTLMAGTIIPGVLISGINSDLPGQIVGQVSENVFDTVAGKHLLIPQGAKVIGQYDSRVVYGQDRALVVWTRIGFPDGSALSLDGMPGTDMSGYAGLSDKVNHHFLRLLTGVVLGSVIGAGAQVAQGDTGTLSPSFPQLALQGAAQNINQAGQRITEKNLSIQPTIEIRPGHRFSVFVTKDLVLAPYRGEQEQ